MVPLDKEVDHAKVYVTPNSDDDDDDENEGEGAQKADDKEMADSLEERDVEVMEVNSDDGDDECDSSIDKIDDDDDEEEEEEEDDDVDYVVDDDDKDDDEEEDEDEDEDEDDDDDNDDDDDDMDDSDYEFTPKFMAETRRSVSDDTVTGEGGHGRKKAVHSKKKPNIKEITIVDADDGLAGNLIFSLH